MVVFKSRALARQGESALVQRREQVTVSQRLTRYVFGAVLALLMLLLGLPAIAAEMSRFQRLVVSLEQAESASRSRFARIALLELAEIHIAEAGLARQESVDGVRPGRLLGWSLAVEAYARELLQLHEEVEQGAQVVLLPALVADPGIVVGPRSIIISHPRRDQQEVLEQAILARFCGQEDCLQLLSAELEIAPQPILESLSNRPPSWSFTRSGPVCEQEGLQIQFPAPGGRSAGNLAQYRSLCQQLFSELRLLVAELRTQLRQGVVPEWDALVISANPHRPEHSVRLNSAGDGVLLAVPLLHSTPGLLARLIPWLRPLAESGLASGLVLQAGELGWSGSPVSHERDTIAPDNP